MSDSSQINRLVLADYFLGFATREVSGGARPWRLYYGEDDDPRQKRSTCDAAFSGDLYLTGNIKEIASTYYPAIGPYDTSDPDVAEYHVLLAKAAGIDGFMAEYTLEQEKPLLNLVASARKYDFRVGVNWISQSHFAENRWRDRAEALGRAHEIVRWLAKHVYQPCGVRYRDRYLWLIFLAHPREPSKPLDAFFSPVEVRQLKQTAQGAGCDANFLVLPWEPLTSSKEHGAAERVWDGYFPWVWSSSGSKNSGAAGWTHVTTREQYVQRLRNYYAMAEKLTRAGRIGTYIGAVCPGFDDHKGQAWGEGYKRFLPRDGGQTLKDTWAELTRSGVDAALIITFNDWIESTQIEPSLELGNADLRECARQIAAWKGATVEEHRLRLPNELLRARRRVRLAIRGGVAPSEAEFATASLDRAAAAIAAGEKLAMTRRLTLDARRAAAELQSRLDTTPIHLFWESGFDATGIQSVGDGAFAVADEFRAVLSRGAFVGLLSFEYFDEGVDFVRVLVDAADEAHRVIASFRKSDTRGSRMVSLDLVNCRFQGGLPGGADFRIEGATVRHLRIDGVSHSPAAPE